MPKRPFSKNELKEIFEEFFKLNKISLKNIELSLKDGKFWKNILSETTEDLNKFKTKYFKFDLEYTESENIVVISLKNLITNHKTYIKFEDDKYCFVTPIWNII